MPDKILSVLPNVGDLFVKKRGWYVVTRKVSDLSYIVVGRLLEEYLDNASVDEWKRLGWTYSPADPPD